ncbi:hypothetical protein [Cecembia lonarensis]|uniref:Lipoprotein n=1 Tax=Cecembia lonarensis (strain CCUG 58316 / KCTC 22772 / LW9) TaxID=1225176 RepID=K1L834_CECL9|nr:hypothetical protein [Cecembia lonarensis]EKB50846.1 hypothetical protein B879_00591 [Cecembia lonarensis LW9]
MKWNSWTVALMLLLCSCRGISPNFQDKDLLSEEPQPVHRKNLYTFPKDWQGLWVYKPFEGDQGDIEIDSVWIDKNTYTIINNITSSYTIEELKENQIWEIKKGTLAVVSEGIDTLFFDNTESQNYSFDELGNLTVWQRKIDQMSLKEDLFLRKVNRNTYALNYKCPDCNGWKVILLQPSNFK